MRALRLTPQHPPPRIPDCRDPGDAPFLVLAASGRAQLPDCGDRDLPAMAGQTRFEIVAPADFLLRLRDNPQP